MRLVVFGHFLEVFFRVKCAFLNGTVVLDFWPYIHNSDTVLTVFYVYKLMQSDAARAYGQTIIEWSSKAEFLANGTHSFAATICTFVIPSKKCQILPSYLSMPNTERRTYERAVVRAPVQSPCL